ncbi:MAG: VTT domain-containing protein [Pseudomonadota bacterium]
MSDKISPILQWLNLHPNSAGLVVFLVCAAESIAILGTIIPGTIAMTAIGTLIGAGVIPVWSTFIWAILGAITGDNVSYWLGYYFKDNLRNTWPFRTRPQWLASGQKFFDRYGSMSVVIGRFFGPTRAIVPVVAGMLRMQPLRFILTSIVASTGWAPLYMLPGIIIGEATMELPPDMAANMMLRLVLVALFVIFCAWTLYKIFILIRDKINILLSAIWEKLDDSRYFSVITKLLRHHDNKKTHGQIILAFYLLITALAFAYLSYYVSTQKELDIVINSAAFYIFRSLRTPAVDDIMLFFTLLGDKKIIIPVIGVVLAWLAYKKHWRIVVHGIILFGLTAVCVVGFKHLFHIMRPWGILNSPESFSYPSGHCTLATSAYIGLCLLLIQSRKIHNKRLILSLALVTIGLVSISRLYLGAHWFTDIIGGWLLSGTLIMLVELSYNRHREKSFDAKRIVTIALLLVVLGSSACYLINYNKLKLNYSQLDWPRYTYTLDTWWSQDKGANLPLYRIGRVGLPIEVLNLQWVGTLDDIKSLLLKQGWFEPSDRGWGDILPRITDVSSAEHLPLVSPLYLGKKPVLVLLRNINGSKKPIVLRLWDSNINIRGTSKELWVGSVGNVPRTYSWLINYKHSSFTLTPKMIFNELPDNYDIKELTTLAANLKHKFNLQPVILIKPKDLS